MPLFKRKQETEAPVVEIEPEAPAGPDPGTPFTGAGACFSEGFYYPVVSDEHGRELGPDRTSPLVWKQDEGHPKGGFLIHAFPDSPNHFHQYGLNAVELEVSPDGAEA